MEFSPSISVSRSERREVGDKKNLIEKQIGHFIRHGDKHVFSQVEVDFSEQNKLEAMQLSALGLVDKIALEKVIVANVVVRDIVDAKKEAKSIFDTHTDLTRSVCQALQIPLGTINQFSDRQILEIVKKLPSAADFRNRLVAAPVFAGKSEQLRWFARSVYGPQADYVFEAANFRHEASKRFPEAAKKIGEFSPVPVPETFQHLNSSLEQGLRYIKEEKYDEAMTLFSDSQLAAGLEYKRDVESRSIILDRTITESEAREVLDSLSDAALTRFDTKVIHFPQLATKEGVDTSDPGVKRLSRNLALWAFEEWFHVLEHETGTKTGLVDPELSVVWYLYMSGVPVPPEYIRRHGRNILFHPDSLVKLTKYKKK